MTKQTSPVNAPEVDHPSISLSQSNDTAHLWRETYGTSHWWKNLTDKPVILPSFDILHDPNDHNM
jgi:hypothetical protein